MSGADTFPSSFLTALANAQIPYDGQVRVDDKIHRYKTQGDHEENCWYILHANGDNFVAGAFGCWKRQIKTTWCSRDKSTFTKEEWGEASKAWKAAEAARAAEELEKQSEARKKCAQMFPGEQPQLHPYLFDKGVSAHGPMPEQGARLDLYLAPTAEELIGWLSECVLAVGEVEACRYLGVSKRTLWRWLVGKALPEAATPKAIFWFHSLLFAPWRVTNGFHVATWGRFAQDPDNPPPEDWSI